MIPITRALGIACCSVLVTASGCSASAPSSEPEPNPAPAPMAPAAEPPTPQEPPLPSAETGFIDVPPQDKAGDPTPGRLFYAYRAADEAPDDKPLLVVFNGGPGGATTSALMAFGTGPYRVTLDPAGAGTVVSNPASFTRFANVLWIDSRLAGFSYAPAPLDQPCAFDALADAGEFIHVITKFIAAHPRLAHTRVGIVGESYGGTRAIAIVRALLDAGGKLGTRLGIQDEVTGWLGTAPSREGVLDRLLGLVLIQPLVLGDAQYAAQDAEIKAMEAQYPGTDADDRRLPLMPDSKHPYPALEAFARPEDALKLFGVDFLQTRGLAAVDRPHGARAPTYGVATDDTFNGVIAAKLGALGPGDRYFDDSASRCGPADPGFIDESYFVDALGALPVFVTDAKYDGLIRSRYIFEVLKTKLGLEVDETTRPGYRLVKLADGRVVPVRFAPYDAGHMVPLTQSSQFTADVRAWLEAPKK